MANFEMEIASEFAGRFVTGEFKPKKDYKYTEFEQKLLEDGVFVTEEQKTASATESDVPDPMAIDKDRRRHARWNLGVKAKIHASRVNKIKALNERARFFDACITWWDPTNPNRRIRRAGKKLCYKYTPDEATEIPEVTENEDIDLEGHWDVDLQEFISEREIPVPVEMPDDPGYSAYIIRLCGGSWDDAYDIQYVVLSWDKCCRKIKEIYDRVESNKEEYYNEDACLYIYPAKIEDDEVVRVKDVPWIVDHCFFQYDLL